MEIWSDRLCGLMDHPSVKGEGVPDLTHPRLVFRFPLWNIKVLGPGRCPRKNGTRFSEEDLTPGGTALKKDREKLKSFTTMRYYIIK